jgi:hypothetical protein
MRFRATQTKMTSRGTRQVSRGLAVYDMLCVHQHLAPTSETGDCRVLQY